MNFVTEVKVEESKEKINHKDNIMMIGSCFTNEIGQKFIESGFNVFINPFGIIYNPYSISECLDYVIQGKHLVCSDLIKVDEYYYAFSCHGDFRGQTKEECLKKINDNIDKAHAFLLKTKYLIITLGTAWTYTYKDNNRVMGNCHKIDSKKIERKMMNVSQVSASMNVIIENIKKNINQDIKIIFTLSPIRHWREGFKDNLLSKSTLYLAINELCKRDDTFYFPSYEIVMDELRDYRFYAQDMLHISELAVDYIWQKFSNCYFDEKTMMMNKDFVKLYLMKNHRPLNPDSEGYKKHLLKIKEMEEKLNNEINTKR
jgi:hypothetical protein